MDLKDSEFSNSIKYNFNNKDWPTPGEAVETTTTSSSVTDESVDCASSAKSSSSLQTNSNNINNNSKGGEIDSSVSSSTTTTTTTTTSSSTTTTTTTTQGTKKGSKNKWRPLEFEPPTSKSEERRHGQRSSRNHSRKDSINNNHSSSEVPNGGATSSKKYGDNNMLQSLNNNKINAVSVPSSSDKGFRGGRRGRGRGRGSGIPVQSNSGNNGGGNGGPGSGGPVHRGGGRSNRSYDPGRITPNHEDFPADIAYYVDYSPISDAAISNEGELDISIISPTLGPPTQAAVAAAFVSPAIVPTTTTFVPTAAFFSPYAAAVTTAALQDPNSLKKSIKSQIEYYFSEENLQRDFFLRRKMDEEGYLPISLIASFHRVKALTTEVALVIDALRGSDKVEFNENGTKLRTTADPLKWPIFDQRQPQI
ncbi:la-related protein 1-like [Panonychus citri]|uniref:la-related protein 1-like n=1 Tax=Panonychus citri TaxID=50023 RepID=UPI002307096E|nr:la-related protein 1-like [Panonychus citri]